MKRNRFGQFALLLATVMLAIAPPIVAGEGFGMMKKTAKLTRVHPPQVFIMGTRVAIRASSSGNRDAMAAQRLQSQLESELLGANTRLKLDASSPDATIDVAVLQNDYSEEWVEREGTRQVKTGSKDSKGKDIYREERFKYRVKIVKHTFGTSFKVHDTRADRSLAADTTNRPFSQEFVEGNGAPDAASLENDGIRAVVADLVHRLAPTREVIGVLLPKGSMEKYISLADAGLWTKYLDSLEKMPPLAKTTDEAYRQYAMGVAHEALGYGAEEADTTLKYLEQASVHYNNAIDAHPKENYFTKSYDAIFTSKTAAAPLTRVQSALVQYQRMKEFTEAIAARSSGTTTGSKGDLGTAVDADALTNASVIEMLRAGLNEEVIFTSINSAKKTSFDVSPKGLIQLAEARASKKLIQHIQFVAGGGQAKPSSTSSNPAGRNTTAGGGQRSTSSTSSRPAGRNTTYGGGEKKTSSRSNKPAGRNTSGKKKP
ncbi:MAG TPA: hypothetical protein VGQ76_10580 [Thermoanaerobaculia bacterium]|jgi:hypothetical protein|nr:hypothetical protein [Thermoanaerobaculia bacterium]